MARLHKPQRARYDEAIVEAYASEDTLYVPSTNACLSCHINPHSSHVSANAALGAAVSMGLFGASVMVNQAGEVTAGVSCGSPIGAQASFTVKYDPTIGPPIVVYPAAAPADSGMAITSPYPQPASAAPDSTRTSQ